MSRRRWPTGTACRGGEGRLRPMKRLFDRSLAEGCSGPSRRARVMSEHRAATEPCCPRCGEAPISRNRNNAPATDLACTGCAGEFELTCTKAALSPRVADGSYSALSGRIIAGKAANLMPMRYELPALLVRDRLVVPRHFLRGHLESVSSWPLRSRGRRSTERRERPRGMIRPHCAPSLSRKRATKRTTPVRSGGSRGRAPYRADCCHPCGGRISHPLSRRRLPPGRHVSARSRSPVSPAPSPPSPRWARASWTSTTWAGCCMARSARIRSPTG